MKRIKQTDNKERDLNLVFKKLKSLSKKASKVLTDSMLGRETNYSDGQILSAKCILEIINPNRQLTNLGIRDCGEDLLSWLGALMSTAGRIPITNWFQG